MPVEKGTKISAENFYFLVCQVPETLNKKHFFDIIIKHVDSLIISRTIDEFKDNYYTHHVLIKMKDRVHILQLHKNLRTPKK